jgi:protocatechuate 3,4-dioxygenase beta subunit
VASHGEADGRRHDRLITRRRRPPAPNVALDKVRHDLTGGQKGLTFRMEIAVVNAKTCKPITNAAVDIWHCKAAGLYSDKSD